MAYFDGESKTFFERYSELIFTGIWGVFIVGSALTGFVAWANRKRQNEGKSLVDEIAVLTAATRSAASAEDVAAIERRGDAIVAQLATQRQNGHVSEALIESAGLALDHYRSVLETARKQGNNVQTPA